jgi:hypothetical protein
VITFALATTLEDKLKLAPVEVFDVAGGQA